MPTRCTSCNITWARLEANDDAPDCCPQCGGDMDLQPADGPGMLKCQLTGIVHNPVTGERLPARELPKPAPYIPIDYAAMHAKREERARRHEQAEDAAIAAYHATGNREDYLTHFKIINQAL